MADSSSSGKHPCARPVPPREMQWQLQVTAAVVFLRHHRDTGQAQPSPSPRGQEGAEAHSRGHVASLQVPYASRLLLGGTAGEVK